MKCITDSKPFWNVNCMICCHICHTPMYVKEVTCMASTSDFLLPTPQSLSIPCHSYSSAPTGELWLIYIPLWINNNLLELDTPCNADLGLKKKKIYFTESLQILWSNCSFKGTFLSHLGQRLSSSQHGHKPRVKNNF